MTNDGLDHASAAWLDEARTQVETAFETLARTLEAANGGLSEVRGEVTRLSALIGQFSGTGAESDQLREKCVGAATLLRAEVREMADGRFDEALVEATTAVAGISRETRQLQVVATLTRVTANAMGMKEINGFVESLRGLVGEIGDAGKAVDRGIRAIAAAQGAARGSLNEAAAQAQEALQAAQARASIRAELQQRHAGLVSRLVALEHQLETTGRNETGALITGVQFADELAQRLRHVQAILADATADQEARAHLASAQVAAVCRDAGSVLARLRRALAHLRDVVEQASEALSTDLGAEVKALLMALGDELDGSARLEQTLAHALAVSLEASREIHTRVERAHESFLCLRESEERITLAAVNAGLLTARWGSAKASMDVLSQAVQDSAGACSARTDGCRSAFAGIDEILSRSRQNDLEAAASELQRLVVAGQGRHAAVVEGFAGLTEMRARAAAAAHTLADAVTSALAALDSLPDGVAALRKLGHGLASDPAPDPAQLATLSGLYDLYTMHCERLVHAELCGETAAAPPPVAQSLEDIFF